jgi:hypothetical protein
MWQQACGLDMTHPPRRNANQSVSSDDQDVDGKPKWPDISGNVIANAQVWSWARDIDIANIYPGE